MAEGRLVPSNHPQQDVELSPTNIQMIGECCSMVSNEDMYSTLYKKTLVVNSL